AAPFCQTLTVPARSVQNSRPSGAKAIAVGKVVGMLAGIAPGEALQLVIGPPPLAALGDGGGEGDGDGLGDGDGETHTAGLAERSRLGQSVGLGDVVALPVAVFGCDGRLSMAHAPPPINSTTGMAITATRTGRGRLLTRLHIRLSM
ncbi:MAG: hypothetical protein WAT58_08775, partial [Candidatus Dormiibacterota bacterium]